MGTDISDAAVAQASQGQYNKFEIERGLSRDKLQKYFTAHRDTWKIKAEIRAMASFRKLNLMLPFAALGKFNIYLPASEKEVIEEKKPAGDTLRGTETVLFVDDEDMIIEVAEELFEQFGYKVLAAGNGTDT